MAGVQPKFTSHGNGTDTVQVVENVKGGQLVEARGSNLAGVAAAGSLVVLGGAMTDAVPATGQAGYAGYTTGYGDPGVDLGVPPADCTILIDGEMALTYAAAATWGQSLKAAANGQVTPLLTSDAANLRIGSCREKAGVAPGGVGNTRISL